MKKKTIGDTTHITLAAPAAVRAKDFLPAKPAPTTPETLAELLGVPPESVRRLPETQHSFSVTLDPADPHKHYNGIAEALITAEQPHSLRMQPVAGAVWAIISIFEDSSK